MSVQTAMAPRPPIVRGGARTSRDVSMSDLHEAAAILAREAGISFPSAGSSSLRRAFARLLAESDGMSSGQVIASLSREPSLLARLISLVRVGETYFFRHPEQLAIVARHILPALAEAGPSGRAPAIHIWSAGCSTGEEAYSLAMVAAAALPADGPSVHITGTDIDRDALRVAETGTYGRWSFRAPLAGMDRWFEADGRNRRVTSAIRNQVTFSLDNLADPAAGLPADCGGAPGLIVCRNVLMYLSPEARRRVAERFLRVLAPGGWLMVAPVELSGELYPGFEPVVLETSTVYRRPLPGARSRSAARGTPRPDARGPRTGPDGATVVASPAARAGNRESATRRTAGVARPTTAERSPRAQRGQTPSSLAAIRTLADQGHLDEAWRLATAAARTRPSDSEMQHLVASIAEARNDLAGAAAALRGAVYLDRADAAAHFRLGLIEWRLGHVRQARARLAKAVRLVEPLDDDAILVSASDLTAARVRTTAAILNHD